jgi:hypothetical protein
LECPNVTTTTTSSSSFMTTDIAGGAANASNTSQLAMAAGAGALVALIVGWVVNKVFGNRRAGYSEIPSHH